MRRDKNVMINNEKELFKRILKGDAQAVENVITAWHPSFVGFISKIVSRDDALDIAQEIYLKLIKRFHRFKNLEHAKRFIFKSGYRKAIDYYRKNRTHNEIHHKIKQTIKEEFLDKSNTRKNDLINDLKTAVEHLSPEEKSVIALKLDYDYTAREIGAHLGVATGTVLYRLHQAKKKIRNFFDNDKLRFANETGEVRS